MIPPSADIIILNCNNAGYIENCVRSVLLSKEPDWNLIIVDQGSSDGSREWLEAIRNENMDNILVIKNETNLGAWEGRNQAIRNSSSETLIFLDSDTEILHRDSLRTLAARLHSNARCGVAEAKVKIHDGTFRFAGFAACAIKAGVFNEIGLFDKHFLIGGDQDFWARFAWNADWEIEFEEWTDILHHCGKTINRDGLDQEKFSKDHKFYRQDLPRHIYTGKFLNETVGKIDRQRQAEERLRGWIQ